MRSALTRPPAAAFSVGGRVLYSLTALPSQEKERPALRATREMGVAHTERERPSASSEARRRHADARFDVSGREPSADTLSRLLARRRGKHRARRGQERNHEES